MFENRTLMELGLPYPKDIESQEGAAKWETLVGKVDEQISSGGSSCSEIRQDTIVRGRQRCGMSILHDEPRGRTSAF